jgi:glycosyltransferase involved in cell wall biosynthesis
VAVYVDIQGAQSRDSAHRGIGRYVAELARALEERDGGALIGGYALNPDLPLPDGLADVIAPERMRPSDRLDLVPGDAYHVTSPFESVALARVWPRPARSDGVRLAVTLYDLIPVIYPEQYLAHDLYRARYENRLGLVRNADRVFSISAATARDASERLGIPPHAVTVAGTGVSARFVRPESREAAFEAVAASVPGLRPEYVLYTGALDFRKNVDTLLVAYSELAPELRKRHQLLIVSRLAQEELDTLRRRLRQLEINRNVRLARAVSDDDLVPLYQAAGLFVFPSLYEGFGLPAAEAISCGAPTIVSRSSSLVEIVENPEALFDPRDPADLKRTLQRFLGDPDRRRALADTVLAERHTWTRVAEHTLSAYERLGASTVRRDRRTRKALASVVSVEESTWSAGAVAGRGLSTRVGRTILWPARRFFDPRFGGVDGHVLSMHGDLAHRMDRAFGPGGLMRRSNDNLRRSVDQLQKTVQELQAGMAELRAERAAPLTGLIPPGARVLHAGDPADGLYDVVVCETLPEDPEEHAALRARLKPGGVLVIVSDPRGEAR